MKKAVKIFLVAACAASLVLCALAKTHSEMVRDGEVSDGAVTFGDERNGIVSDVGEDAGEIISDVGEGASQIVSDVGEAASDLGDDLLGREPQKGDATTKASETSGADGDARGNATTGILVAVALVIVVVGIIFFLFKRK